MARAEAAALRFLNAIFEPTRYHANATLRGFYFTSGTQEGTPIDQLIGSLARSFGAEEVARVAYSGQRQELLPAPTCSEGGHRRGRLGVDRPRRRAPRHDHQGGRLRRRSRAVAIGARRSWWISYKRNSDADRRRPTTPIADYRAAAGPLAAARRRSPTATSHKVLPLLAPAAQPAGRLRDARRVRRRSPRPSA